MNPKKWNGDIDEMFDKFYPRKNYSNISIRKIVHDIFFDIFFYIDQ